MKVEEMLMLPMLTQMGPTMLDFGKLTTLIGEDATMAMPLATQIKIQTAQLRSTNGLQIAGKLGQHMLHADANDDKFIGLKIDCKCLKMRLNYIFLNIIFEMQNFDIEGTGDDLNQSVKKASEEEKKQNNQNLVKTYDDFDVMNCGLQCVFKVISILLYLILKLLTDSYLATFVVTVLLISFDFWTTKNLTARKLVGLRWWSEISDDGQEQWVFQSRNPSRVPHNFNVVVFWVSQIISVAFWGIIVIINCFTISIFWIGLALFCLLLSLINFICFFKCRGEHQKKAQQLKQKFGIRSTGDVSLS